MTDASIKLQVLLYILCTCLTTGVFLWCLLRVSRWIPPIRHEANRELILFFDGVCGLCNGLVDMVMKEDRAERFRFSPLQGKYAARVLTSRHINDLDTVVLRDGDDMLEKSDAVLRLGEHLGGVWRLASLLGRWIPRSLRNWAYDQVARHRYRFFGMKSACRVPTPAERMRFVD